jgi:hypothetical protein
MAHCPQGKKKVELGRGGYFFIFPLFSTCSLQVLNGFPMYSPKVFSIAPDFNPICFAQSPPLLTYIAGAKGGSTPLFHRIFYFREPL